MTIVLTLPDGSERTVPAGTTALDVAHSIGPRLAQDAVGAELAGRRIDLREPLFASGPFKLFTTRNPEASTFSPTR